MVYFTPFFGGIIADRYLGQHKTVLVGGILMAAGHFLMTMESCFLLALLLLIVGNGCFKPNVSTQVAICIRKTTRAVTGRSPFLHGHQSRRVFFAVGLWHR